MKNFKKKEMTFYDNVNDLIGLILDIWLILNHAYIDLTCFSGALHTWWLLWPCKWLRRHLLRFTHSGPFRGTMSAGKLRWAPYNSSSINAPSEFLRTTSSGESTWIHEDSFPTTRELQSFEIWKIKYLSLTREK